MFQLPEYRHPDFSLDTFKNAPDAAWETVTMDGVAPENYHSTSMYPEYFIYESSLTMHTRYAMKFASSSRAIPR